MSGVRLVARAAWLRLDLELASGEAVRLDGRGDRHDRGAAPGAIASGAAAVAWFAGAAERHRGDRLVIDGRHVTRRGPAGRTRAGLSVVTETPVAPEVSVRDHFAAVVTPARADAVLAEVPRLAGRGADPAGVLSGGERRLLAWARTVLLRPRVVVLDRAATGLDADATAWATDRVARWRRDHGVVVLVLPGRVEEERWAAASAP